MCRLRDIIHKIATGLLLMILASCASTPKEDFRDAYAVPYDGHSAPLLFTSLKIMLPTGSNIGSMSESDRGCFWPYHDVNRGAVRDIINKEDLRNIFEETLETLGYDVVGSEKTIYFDEELDNDLLRAEYKIGARVTKIQTAACYQNQELGLFGFEPSGYKGQFYATFEWNVFDNLNKRTVYKTVTSGYSDRPLANEEGMTLMMNDAFEMAVHNLAADKGFYDLVVNGFKPEEDGLHEGKDHRDKPRRFDSNEVVAQPRLPRRTSPVNLAAGTLQQNAVMVQGGLGHGSGFFISDQGHIITNHHVVGEARRVRVVTSGKREKLIAEVLRTDRVRDVALLKLETMPPGLHIQLLPARLDWPKVGEDVYVVGAPRLTSLQDTVTKGIISARRPDMRIFGVTVDLLQADVATHGGNSGGPMFDAYGNLVGMSVAGYDPSGLKSNAALNLFIPIEGAFRALDIQ